ncbi:hypothetical protein GCM10023189_59210 [Nibrella saemangeumensis]|uniref:Protein kinase domain-containing protein n=1 Tax=Nibrella saemangeumensis TaxID=1084526 RepID=A0ABP8NSB7_9BACT
MPTVSFNTQFPGYTILGELGRGNARVLKARHVDTGTLVAIKHFAFNTDADTLRRFQQESEIMTRINHPNIVGVREIRLDAPLPYLVMELIEGGSVRKLLDEQKTLPVATVVRLGLQLIEAFKAIHAQGIIHRDVKPENILYRVLPTGELHFLLTDFGIARLREQPKTVTGQSLMTYEYASPEQFEDPGSLGAATDYYSMGVVLYECLTGRVPFPMGKDTGIVSFMTMLLNDPPPSVASLTDKPIAGSLEDLLQALMTKKAADRLSNPDAVIVDLKKAEVEQLLLEQEGRQAEVVPAGGLAQGATRPVAGAVQPAETRKAPPEFLVRKAAQEPTDRTSRRTGLWVGLLALGLLGAGLGTYYVLSKEPETTTESQQPDAEDQQDLTVNTPVQTGTVVTTSKKALIDEAKRKEEESRKQQEQRRQEGLKAAKRLAVKKVPGYKVGLIGGIKNLQIRLDNPTNLRFSEVQVRVSYILENGKIFKAEQLTINDIEPKSSKTVNAPDSPRGTKVWPRILDYKSPDIPPKPVKPSVTAGAGDSTGQEP